MNAERQKSWGSSGQDENKELHKSKGIDMSCDDQMSADESDENTEQVRDNPLLQEDEDTAVNNRPSSDEQAGPSSSGEPNQPVRNQVFNILQKPFRNKRKSSNPKHRSQSKGPRLSGMRLSRSSTSTSTITSSSSRRARRGRRGRRGNSSNENQQEINNDIVESSPNESRSNSSRRFGYVCQNVLSCLNFWKCGRGRHHCGICYIQ